jgi:hypothetical protein
LSALPDQIGVGRNKTWVDWQITPLLEAGMIRWGEKCLSAKSHLRVLGETLGCGVPERTRQAMLEYAREHARQHLASDLLASQTAR